MALTQRVLVCLGTGRRISPSEGSGQVGTDQTDTIKNEISRDVTPFELTYEIGLRTFFQRASCGRRTLAEISPRTGARPCFPEQLCGDASAMLRVRAALRHRWEEALGITFGAHGKEVNRTVLVLTSPPSSISLRAVVDERMLARGTNVLQASGDSARAHVQQDCVH